MTPWLILALQAAAPAPAIPTYDLPAARRPIRTTLSGCAGDEPRDRDIVVCGRRENQNRLPLPVEHDLLTEPLRGEIPGGMAALVPSGRCGIFAGERRCNKREAARYGYGTGRDPITLLTGLARKAVDPDAD